MRIQSIDRLRGLCVLFMIITHGLSYWLPADSMWLFVFEGVSLGGICASGWVFVAGASFGFSWAKGEGAGVSREEQYLKGLTSALVLLGLSIVFNISSAILNSNGWESIFWWHLFQCLAFSRLLGLLFAKVKRIQGIFLAIILIVLVAIFLQGIDFGETTDPIKSTLFILFFNPLETYPFLIYFPFYLMGMLIGKELFNYTEKPTANRELVKHWLLIGISFVIVGLVLGSFLDSHDLGWPFTKYLATFPGHPLTSVPFVLRLDTYAWCFFFNGVQIIIVILWFYFLDMRKIEQNKRKKQRKGMLDLFGQYSLTIYVIHLAAFIFPLTFNYLEIWGPIVLLTLIVWFGFWQLDRIGKGKYSIEYVLGIFGEWMYLKLKVKFVLKQPPLTENIEDIAAQ